MVGKILENSSANFGYNAQTGEYGDMIAMGIVDPVKVVRTALQDAASVASLLITTEAMIAELPKDAARPCRAAVAWAAWAAWTSKSRRRSREFFSLTVRTAFGLRPECWTSAKGGRRPAPSAVLQGNLRPFPKGHEREGGPSGPPFRFGGGLCIRPRLTSATAARDTTAQHPRAGDPHDRDAAADGRAADDRAEGDAGAADGPGLVARGGDLPDLSALVSGP